MNFLKSSGIRGKFLSIVILFLCLMVAGFAITFKLITDMKSDVHVINITTRQGTLVEQYLKSFFFFMETKKIENVTKVVKEFEHNLSVLKEGVKKKSNIIVEGDSEDYEIDSYDIEKELDPYVLNEWKEIGIAWEDLKSVAIGLLSEEGEKKNSGYVVLIENAKKLTARIDQLVLFEQQRSGQKFKNILYSQVAIIALSLLASLIVIVFLNSSYLRSLIQNFSKIDHLAMILLEETKNILTNANVVSKNAEGLSSAVQQTMSAATQLTEITKKNTEITLHSSKKSKDSSKQSESGKKVVRDLIKTIEDVDGANKDLVEQVEKNNNEIHRILEFVHKIS